MLCVEGLSDCDTKIIKVRGFSLPYLQAGDRKIRPAYWQVGAMNYIGCWS